MTTKWITPTVVDRAEWARMAQTAYKNGHNAVGHRYSAAAGTLIGRISIAHYDSLMRDYRAWLIDGVYATEDTDND